MVYTTLDPNSTSIAIKVHVTKHQKSLKRNFQADRPKPSSNFTFFGQRLLKALPSVHAFKHELMILMSPDTGN